MHEVATLVIAVTAISAWITGFRMRRKIRGVLGRKATATDLASISTWMKVDERERQTGWSGSPILEPVRSRDHLPSAVAGCGKPDISLGQVRLVGHLFPVPGAEIIQMTFGAGKLGYILMGLFPVLAIWCIGPNSLANAPWLRWAILAYASAASFGTICLQTLKLEIRADGIRYATMFQGSNFIAFSEISSVVLLTNPHSRVGISPIPRLHNMEITPKPDTGKPTLKISLLLLPIAAREQLLRLLKPDELDDQT